MKPIAPYLIAVAAATCLVGAAALTASEPTISVKRITRLGVSSLTVTCGLNLGTCNYLILTSLCQEKLVQNDVKERTCHYSAPVPGFRLSPGESKTVSKLPSDFLYGMKLNAMPTPEEVVNAPMAH
jgi:hypothetical protein